MHRMNVSHALQCARQGSKERGYKDESDAVPDLKQQPSKRERERERERHTHVSLQDNLVSAVISPSSFNSLPVPQGAEAAYKCYSTGLLKLFVMKDQFFVFVLISDASRMNTFIKYKKRNW